MFSDIVIQLAANPLNTGPLEDATNIGIAGVPGDGPYMELWLKVVDHKIKQAAFRTYGCPAAIASGSMLTQLAIGRSVTAIERLTALELTKILGGLPEGKEHCAQLAIDCLRNSIKEKMENV